jgi:hypothetical protein
MRLFCPYTIAHAPTVATVLAAGGELVALDGHSAYLDYLEARWRDMVVWGQVEHDVEATVGQLSELAACPEEWCGFGAIMAGGDRSSEGGSVSFCCVKFAPSFMEKTGRVWLDFRDFLADRFRTGDGRWRWDGHQAPWSLCSDWLPWWLEHFGHDLAPHKHTPAVVNARPHHAYPDSA